MNFPLGNGVKLLKEHPCGLFAFFKPDGLLSHPNSPRDHSRALFKAPYHVDEECYDIEQPDGKRSKIWLLNRLDSATSGVLLCADHQGVAEAVRRKFAEDRVEKKYFALVFGVLKPPRQVWRDRLQVSRKNGKVRTSFRGGLFAETEANVVRTYPGRYPISLLELRPKTGRTHQLRVQSAKRKVPIVGDQTYGNFSWNREFAKATRQKRLFLHSAEVRLTFEVDGRAVDFFARSELPKEFTP